MKAENGEIEQDTAAGDGKTNDIDKLIKDGGDIDPAKFAKTFIAYLEQEVPTADWDKIVKKNGNLPNFLKTDDFRKFMYDSAFHARMKNKVDADGVEKVDPATILEDYKKASKGVADPYIYRMKISKDRADYMNQVHDAMDRIQDKHEGSLSLAEKAMLEASDALSNLSPLAKNADADQKADYKNARKAFDNALEAYIADKGIDFRFAKNTPSQRNVMVMAQSDPAQRI